ncbi:MAG TPA: non-homologous end-joining DNA ligase [Methylomirabilota bacterium]|nr:non-homologous end-joining DNA ligase [Methylomirabilota bacterium]
MASRDLGEYRRKRDPTATPEPFGGPAPAGGSRFVVHKHSARRLHYDLRLEIDGVLKSWAVPKGPSMRSHEKRLAVHVEDHPVEYADFEGVIPEGSYGAGPSIVWDAGRFELLKPEPASAQIERGKLEFELFGYKLRGAWTLARMSGKDRDWLLLKKSDQYVSETEPTERYPESVLSGLTIEELREGAGRVDALRRRLTELGAPRASIEPGGDLLMLATLVETTPSDTSWLFEIKYDGVRVLATRAGDEIELRHRSNQVVTARYPEVVAALHALPLQSFMLDGEIVALDDRGRSSFQRLQERMGLTRPADVERARGQVPVSAVVFDALALDGRDLRRLPLEARKECLKLLVPPRGVVYFGDHVLGQGADFLAAACEQGLEGVVAKRRDSAYASKRSRDWLKIKCHLRQEFVVGGYTVPQGARTHFGALHLGLYERGELVYVSKVGTGFDDRALESISEKLRPLVRATSPFARGTPAGRGHTWVEPRLVAEVRFGEWTRDGGIRHPSFVGLRSDKRPEECVRETAVVAAEEEERARGSVPPTPSSSPAGDTTDPMHTSSGRLSKADGDRGAGHRRSSIAKSARTTDAGGPASGARGAAADAERSASDPRGGAQRRSRSGAEAPSTAGGEERRVTVTNAGKVFWPDEGYTKSDLIGYYEAVAKWLLPYLQDRPLVLTRYPDGITGKSFFQKDAPEWTPSWVRTQRIHANDVDRDIDYFVVDDLESLRYVVNLGTIPLHLWSSRLASLDHPDWLVLDLDPKGAPFTDVVKVARALHGILDELELPSYVKTSGATGLHIFLPLGAGYDFEVTRTFARLLATIGVEAEPSISTIARPLQSRGGKVYIDFGQNGRGQTVVAPFSARPLPGAPVSCPLRWEEVTAKLDPARFTIKTAPARFAKLGDPLAPVLAGRIDLAAALQKLERRRPAKR